MPEATDWNTKTINEFHAQRPRWRTLRGAPMVLVTDRGRKSGHQHVTPTMYLPDETDDHVIYVFATKGGAPSNPDWYYNLTTVGEGSIERGTDSYPVTVREVTGDDRDRFTPNKPTATPASPTTQHKPKASAPSPSSRSPGPNRGVTMTTRTYDKGGFTVFWDSTRCIHTGIWFRSLHSVFNVQNRPWVTLYVLSTLTRNVAMGSSPQEHQCLPCTSKGRASAPRRDRGLAPPSSRRVRFSSAMGS